MCTKQPVLPAPHFPMGNTLSSPSSSGNSKGDWWNGELQGTCKPWDKLSSFLGREKGFYWPNLSSSFVLWSNIPGTANSKSLMPLCPKQIVWRIKDLRGGLSVHRDHTRERVAMSTSLPKPVLTLPKASFPTCCTVVAGKQLPATLERCRRGTWSPWVPLLRQGASWWGRGFSTCVPCPRGVWAEAVTETRTTLLERASDFISLQWIRSF